MLQRTITIQPFGEYVEKITGSVFAVISATAPFAIRLDNRATIPMESGRKLVGEPFTRLVFVETTGAPVTIAFYAGDKDITPPVAVSNTVTMSFANDIAINVPTVPVQFARVNNTPGTPLALTQFQTFFRKAKIIAKKSLSGAANTGIVKLGPSAAVNEQPFELFPGDEITLEAPLGAKWSFTSWYIDVINAGDGVVVIYS